MPAGQHGSEPAIGFFGPGRGQVAGTQAGFDVGNRNLAIEGSQGSRKGGAGITVHEDEFRIAFCQYPVQCGKHARGQLAELLAGLPQVEHVVGHQTEEVQHRQRHVAMLAAEAETGRELGRSRSASTRGAILIASGRVPLTTSKRVGVCMPASFIQPERTLYGGRRPGRQGKFPFPLISDKEGYGEVTLGTGGRT